MGDAVADFTADGWRVIGRLQATFHGIDTEDDFWEHLDCSEGASEEGAERVTTLYLTEPYSTVRKDGDSLVIKIPANKAAGTAERQVRVPLLKIDQVIVLADSTVTTPALLALLEQKTEVCYCSYNGQFAGRLAPECSRNGLLRIEQHRARTDYGRRMELARAFVAAKLANQRTQVLRAKPQAGRPGPDRRGRTVGGRAEKRQEPRHTA